MNESFELRRVGSLTWLLLRHAFEGLLLRHRRGWRYAYGVGKRCVEAPFFIQKSERTNPPSGQITWLLLRHVFEDLLLRHGGRWRGRRRCVEWGCRRHTRLSWGGHFGSGACVAQTPNPRKQSCVAVGWAGACVGWSGYRGTSLISCLHLGTYSRPCCFGIGAGGDAPGS